MLRIISQNIQKRLSIATGAMCLQLSLLYGALLHILLLTGELIHLDFVGLVDEGFDRVQF